MADLFGTTQVYDDPEHWSALAARVVAAAISQSNRSGFDWLVQSRAGWVAASWALIVILASAILTFRQPSASSGAVDLVQALAPSDGVGRAITLPDRAPAIGRLLLGPVRSPR